jgi:hypothetical protein
MATVWAHGCFCPHFADALGLRSIPSRPSLSRPTWWLPSHRSLWMRNIFRLLASNVRKDRG